MHDLEMIDRTLREHRAVVVSAAGVVLAVAPGVPLAVRRAGKRLKGATVYAVAAYQGAEQDVAEAGGTLVLRPRSNRPDLPIGA